MKHQTVSKRSLPQAIELLEELDGYLETTTAKALSHSNENSTVQVNQAALKELFLIR